MEPSARGQPGGPRGAAREDPRHRHRRTVRGRGWIALSGAAVCASLLLAACAPRPLAPRTRPQPPAFGLYKGRIEAIGEKAHRFRLLLFAELPDRLHGELLSPLGAPQLILDGGGGRLAVTFVREGESFVGAADAGALERVLGVRLALDELVRALLTGALPAGTGRVERVGAAAALPDSLELVTDDARLSLVLRRLRPLEADAQSLGRGRAPEGTVVRPLGDLAREGERLEELTGEQAAR